MTARRNVVLGVFIAAFAVRLIALACFLPRMNPEADADWYRELGRNLLADKGFVAAGPNEELLPQVDRTPGYPLFLAVLMRIGGDRLGWLLFVQCILSAATAALTALLALRWLSCGWAAVAGLLVALDPNSVVRALDLRTETCFTVVAVAAVCVMAWEAQRDRGWWLGGLLWSVATFCRPIAIGVWVVTVLVVLARRLPWRFAVLFLAGFLPLICLWSARNLRLTGHWFYSTAATYNLYDSRASGIEAERTGVDFNTMLERFSHRFRYIEFFKDRPTFDEELRECSETSRRIIASAPMVMVKQYIMGWGKMLFGPGARSLSYALNDRERGSFGWWARSYVLVLVVETILAAMGAIRLGRSALLISALVLYFVLLSGGPGGNSRFRTPITPFVAVLAASGARSFKKTA